MYEAKNVNCFPKMFSLMPSQQPDVNNTWYLPDILTCPVIPEQKNGNPEKEIPEP